MATISEIVEVGDGDHDPDAIPTLDAYFARVAVARDAAPRSPWESTEEAMRELRVAEEEPGDRNVAPP